MVKIYISHISTKKKKVPHFREMTMNLQYIYKTKIFSWFHNPAKLQQNLNLSSLGHPKMQAQ